jgi:hypothetical protein
MGLTWMSLHYARNHQRLSPWGEYQKIRRDFHEPLAGQPRVEKRIDNTSLYSPVAYLPALLGAWVARGFNCSASGFIYCSRIGSMLSYTLLGWLTIRLLPVLRWTAFLALAAPMAVYQGTVVTADTTAISTTLLAVALVLNIAMCETRWPLARVAALAIVLGAMTLCKSAYAPVVILVLGIPVSRWPGHRWLYPLAIIVGCACVAGAWIWLARPLGTNLTEIPDPARQSQWVQQHPLLLAQAILRTTWREKFFYVQSYVGYFGWLDFFLPTAAIFFWLALFLSTAITTADTLLVSWRMRLAAAAGLLGSLAMIFVSQYILWTGYQNKWVDGVQGRYLIPLGLLLPVILHANLRPRWPDRTLVAIAADIWDAPLLRSTSTFSVGRAQEEAPAIVVIAGASSQVERKLVLTRADGFHPPALPIHAQSVAGGTCVPFGRFSGTGSSLAAGRLCVRSTPSSITWRILISALFWI